MKTNAKTNIINIFLYALLLFFAVVSIYPLIWMTLNSFKDNTQIFTTNSFGLPQSWDFTNYKKAFSNFRIDIFFRNSIVVSAATVVLTCLFSSMFAYGVTRMKWKGQNLALSYVLLGLMIPIQVILIPLSITIRDLHLFNSHAGLYLPYTALNVAFTSTVLCGYIKNLPVALEEAACIDGANIYQIFLKIILPMLKPALATAAIFVFLNAWNEFNLALVLTSKPAAQTLPLGLRTFMGEHTTDWGGMSAAMVISSLPTVLIYLFFSESVENALTVGAAVK